LPHKQIGIGIIGCGRIGRLHAHNISRHVSKARLVGLADPFIEKGDMEWVRELGSPLTYTDYRDLLAHPDVDAVFICSPTTTHAEYLIEAATLGKHVFCEKPIDLRIERTEEALTVAREAGIVLQVGFNRRFDPSFANVRERCKAGEIGQIDIIKITSRDPEPPPIMYIEQSGGIFVDMSIHDIDMCRYIAGSEVTAVQAAGSVRADAAIGEAGDVDTAVLMLFFENGAMAVIDNSRQACYGYDQRIEVFGRLGMLRAENDTPTRVESFTGAGWQADKPHWYFPQRFERAFVREVEAFVDSVERRAAPMVGGEDGLAALLIAQAANQALRLQRRVVIDEIMEQKAA